MSENTNESIRQIEENVGSLRRASISSERSTFLNRARLGGGIDCSLFRASYNGCWISTDPVNSGVTTQLMDQATKTSIILNAGIQTPASGGVGANFNGTSAKYGDKGYELLIGPSGRYIVEWIIDIPNSTASLGQVYSLIGNIPSQNAVGSAMCSKDASTLLLGENEVAEAQLQTNGTWSYNTLFALPSGYEATGDIIYRPSDNTIIISVDNDVNYEIHHYEYNGVLIDQIVVNTVDIFTMFCSGGSIYTPATGFSSTGIVLYEIETNPLAMVVATPNYPTSYPQDGDGGTSPECCDGGGTSTGCYNIGDITPTGGIVFSLPYTGNNNTPYYYEIALDNLVEGGTPTTGFNLTCGGDPNTTSGAFTTPETANVGITPGNTSVSFGFGPNNAVNQNFNYIDYTGWEVSGVNDNGNPLWPPGTTVVSTSYPAVISLSAGMYLFTFVASSPPSGTLTLSPTSIITFTPQPPITYGNFSVIGAEWGVHNESNISTSIQFGEGENNTNNIDAYPQTVGVHPWLPSHDIAAKICKQYSPSTATIGTNDWFLPSLFELEEAIQKVGPGTAFGSISNVTTGNPSLSGDIYWTSSQLTPTDHVGGGECDENIVYLRGNPPELYHFDHSTGTSVLMTGPPIVQGGDISMWDNKIYSPSPGGAVSGGAFVREYEADYTSNTYVLVRDIPLPDNTILGTNIAYWPSSGNSMKNASNILIHWEYFICEFDISGTTAVLVNYVNCNFLQSLGDLVYYPNNDTALVATQDSGGGVGIVLINASSGSVIDTIPNVPSMAMYKFNGSTYIHHNGVGVREVTFNPLSLGPVAYYNTVQGGWQLGGNTVWSGADSACTTSIVPNPPADPDKYSWAYDVSNNAYKLAYRCHALSVRPIRKFECETDTGIDYDYRFSDEINWGALGVIDWMGQPMSHITTTYSVDAQVVQNGWQGTAASAGVVLQIMDDNLPGPLPVGTVLDFLDGSSALYLGPITSTSVITTPPNLSNITQYIFANNPQTPLMASNIGAIVNITWSTQVVSPSYVQPIFGTGFEIGHQTFSVRLSRWDIRGNDLMGTGQTSFGYPVERLPAFIGKTFNIKVYTNSEILIADYDYKLTSTSGNCGAIICSSDMIFELVGLNYKINNGHPSVVDLKHQRGRWSKTNHGSSEGHAYVSLTCEEPATMLVPPSFNQVTYSWNSYPRGNTLNLENWRGTGINNRLTDQANLPPVGQLAWAVQCAPCGCHNHCHTCVNLNCREYFGELDPATSFAPVCPSYTGHTTLYYPSSTHTGEFGPGWWECINTGCISGFSAKIGEQGHEECDEALRGETWNETLYIVDNKIMSEQRYKNLSTEQEVIEEQLAPPGYHYMPDGTLMSDEEHIKLYGSLDSYEQAVVEEVEQIPVAEEPIQAEEAPTPPPEEPEEPEETPPRTGY